MKDNKEQIVVEKPVNGDPLPVPGGNGSGDPIGIDNIHDVHIGAASFPVTFDLDKPPVKDTTIDVFVQTAGVFVSELPYSILSVEDDSAKFKSSASADTVGVDSIVDVTIKIFHSETTHYQIPLKAGNKRPCMLNYLGHSNPSALVWLNA